MSASSSIATAAEEKQALLPKHGLLPTYGDQEKGFIAAAQDTESDEFLSPTTKYFPFLDITRICCVWCVAVDHGNSSFGLWNMMFTQEWVLQYLFLVCGVSYGLSSKSLANYLGRLAVYAAIGISVNWTAWIVTGMDWRSNFFNVIFHIWFVIGLMGYAVLLFPLKVWLARVRNWPRSDDRRHVQEPTPEAEHPLAEQAVAAEQRAPSTSYRDVLLKYLAGIGGGLLAIFILFQVVLDPVVDLLAPEFLEFWKNMGAGAAFWGLPMTLGESRAFLQHMSTYFMLTCSNIYLVVACPLIFENASLTTWGVLINTYGHRLLFYRSKEERPFHGLDLMMVALTCYYLGLRNRRKIGEYVIRYWFVVLFFCALLWPPGTLGRFDEHPPTDLERRIRWNLLEAIFVIIWLVAGERLVQKEIFTEDRLDFLNEWALILFLVHKAVHIMFVPPLNWVALVGLAPVCYILRRKV
mmetsp:Transcript_11573/g.24385  ORF Transcript_11573/g.24385 Transcript_11573/m.24385 type:complete len:466 (-) Transcript_11573:88-1485(-)